MSETVKFVSITTIAADRVRDDLNLPDDLDELIADKVVSVVTARNIVLKEHGTTNKEYQSKINTYTQQIKSNVERYNGDVEWFKIDANKKRGNILINRELYEDIDKEMAVSNVTEMADSFSQEEAAQLIATIAEGQGGDLNINDLLSMFQDAS